MTIFALGRIEISDGHGTFWKRCERSEAKSISPSAEIVWQAVNLRFAWNGRALARQRQEGCPPSWLVRLSHSAVEAVLVGFRIVDSEGALSSALPHRCPGDQVIAGFEDHGRGQIDVQNTFAKFRE